MFELSAGGGKGYFILGTSKNNRTFQSANFLVQDVV